jgi:hypothetical protein
MPLDASIFARFQPKSVLEYDTEAQTALNNKATNEVNALKLIAARRGEDVAKRDYENDNAFNQYVKANAQTMQSNPSQFVNDATAQGYSKQALGFQKTLDDRAKSKAEIDKNLSETRKRDLDTAKEKIGLIGNSWGAAMQDPTQAISVINDLEVKGLYPKEHAQKYRDAIGVDPNNARLIAEREFRGAINAAQQLYGHIQQDTGSQQTISAFDPVKGTTKVVSTLNKDQTPDSKASDIRIATERETKRIDAAKPDADKFDSKTGMMISPQGIATPVRTADGTAIQNKDLTDKPLSKQALAAYNMGLKELQKDDAAVSSANELKQAYERWRDLNAKTGPIAGRRPISFDDDYQELKKLESYLTINNFKPGQGAISNIERQFMKGAGPNTQNNEETNRNIVNIGLGAAENMKDRANFKEVYLQKNNNLLGSEKVWQDYIDANPRFIKDTKGKIVPNTARTEWTQYFENDLGQKSTASVKPAISKSVSMQDVVHTIEDLKARGITKTQQQVIQDLKNKGYEVK